VPSINRRRLLQGVSASLLVAPLAAEAQPAGKIARIGILAVGTTADLGGPRPQRPAISAFLGTLRELGYVYGEHFVTEARGDEGRPERHASLAAEMVRLRVDVIVASGQILAALKQATSTIPVVMAGAGDPVGDGLVRSLGRPGGNFTGLSLQSLETTTKRLELLKEVVPGATAVGVLWDRSSPSTWQIAEAAARQRGWKLLPLEIRDGAIEGAFKKATAAHAGAVLVAAPSLAAHPRRVAELVARSRLPAMYGARPYVDAGGLMSYSADLYDIYRRSASFVDKILKGAKPADLPVEQPSKFELVINLKTAKALGLTIPQSVLVRADQIIE